MLVKKYKLVIILIQETIYEGPKGKGIISSFLKDGNFKYLNSNGKYGRLILCWNSSFNSIVINVGLII